MVCEDAPPAIDLAIERSAKLLRFYAGKGSVPYGDHAPWIERVTKTMAKTAWPPCCSTCSMNFKPPDVSPA
jgi:hypothetical protein